MRLHDTSFRFTFVRHPIAYYESVWKWLNQGSPMRKYWKWHPFMSAYKLFTPNFDNWVCRMLEEEPAWYTRLVESYIGPLGGEFVNFIGRTETLATHLKEILIGLGYERQVKERWTAVEELEHVGVLPQTIQWKPSLKRDMLATERSMIERFYGAVFNKT